MKKRTSPAWIGVLVCLITGSLFAQNQDSIFQVRYTAAVEKLNAGAFRDASTQLSQLITAGYKNPEAHLNRGIAYYQLKDYEKAIADFDYAEKNGTASAKIHEYRGNARVLLKDWAGAITDLEKLLSTGRSDVEIIQRIGTAKYALKDYKGAVESLTRVVSRGVKDEDVFTMLGLSHAQLK